jgi:hypothetical protein
MKKLYIFAKVKEPYLIEMIRIEFARHETVKSEMVSRLEDLLMIICRF